MDVFLGIGIGVALGVLGAAVIVLVRRGQSAQQLAAAEHRISMFDADLAERERAIEEARLKIADMNAAREDAERQLAVCEEKLAAKDARFEEEQKLRAEMEERLADTFDALSAKALRESNQQFFAHAGERFKSLLEQFKGEDEKTKQAIDNLVKPIRELIDKQNAKLVEIEKQRVQETSGLQKHLEMIAQAHQNLTSETNRLVTALRRPEQRGRWGEMQLRNVVEMAGMSMHCDFDEQVTIWRGDSRQRPDMVARMPGGGVIVIDAKAALDAYLDALQPDCDRDAAMRRHADIITRHAESLAKKEYWSGFERTPKLVVMFMPLESALMAALEVKPDLHAEAMRNHVLIATPTLLVALLRAVAYGWQQEDIAANAREISKAGQELYGRLAKFAGDLDTMGTHLARATRTYNEAIGSFERRVLPSTRRLKELHATTYDEVEPPARVDVEVRPLGADELRSIAEEVESGGPLFNERE